MAKGKTIYTGDCVGGPMAGREGQSRFPKGFVLVDKPNQRAWIYDWSDGPEKFVVREPQGRELDHAGRLRAAEEPDFDVRAYDDGVIPDDVEVGS